METTRRKVWPTDFGGGGENQTATPNAQAQAGIRCAKCGCARSRVVYVRDYGPGARVRRRECANCGHRYSTFEKTAG